MVNPDKFMKHNYMHTNLKLYLCEIKKNNNKQNNVKGSVNTSSAQSLDCEQSLIFRFSKGSGRARERQSSTDYRKKRDCS